MRNYATEEAASSSRKSIFTVDKKYEDCEKGLMAKSTARQIRAAIIRFASNETGLVCWFVFYNEYLQAYKPKHFLATLNT